MVSDLGSFGPRSLLAVQEQSAVAETQLRHRGNIEGGVHPMQCGLPSRAEAASHLNGVSSDAQSRAHRGGVIW